MSSDPLDTIVKAIGVGLAFAGFFLLLPSTRREFAAASGPALEGAVKDLEEAPEFSREE